MINNNQKLRTAELIFIFLTALGAMLICTKSSPLYPMNDWADANCYMTVGRSMLKGKLPYRDLFEHKGPLLYMLHALAALVSDSSFIGMFFAETAACFWFLLLSLKMTERLSGRRCLWTVPVTALAVYSSGAFSHGDSAEELCLPLILCALLTGLNALSDKRSMTSREAFVSGAMAGLILWTKFSLLGAFAGIILIIAAAEIKRGAVRSLIKTAGWTLLGAVTVTAPVLIFFAANNAADSLFQVYFHDNIFVYGGSSPILTNLSDGFVFLTTFMPAGFALIYLGTAAALLRKRTVPLTYFSLSAVISFLMIFAGHLSYQYYPLPLAAFVPYGLGMCVSEISSRAGKLRIHAGASAVTAFAVCIAGCLLLSPNTYLMKFSRSEMPQYKFAEIINETPNASVLNYGFLDGGFYLASGTLPEYRFFCRNNTGLAEMISSQSEYVSSGKPDYIITRSYSGKRESFPLYTCIAEADFPYYKRIPTYYLYRRNDLQ